MGRHREIMSFDDIVFENRNKEYGAYILRKKYNSLLIKALIVTMIISAAAVVIPYFLILNKTHKGIIGSGRKYVSVRMENISPPPTEIIVPPDITPPPAPAQSVVKYTAPVIVDTITYDKLILPTTDEARNLENKDGEAIAIAEGSGGDELFGEGRGDTPYDFFILEEPPKFRGGDLDKFREWLQRRIIYPPEAQEKGIQGKVILTFVVERDGTVTNVNIVKGVHKLLDEEAKRAIESSPQWTPGMQKGRPVRVRFKIDLNFVL